MPFVIKEGASLRGLQLLMRPVLIEAERIFGSFGLPCVVTSGLDGTHSSGSYHYYGYALDFRSSHIRSKTDKSKILALLKEKLGPKYLVILEAEGTDNEHYHIDARGFLS
jgi:hypothetical protein